MKIAYVTVKIPYGDQEAFIVPEIKELLRQKQNVAIFPFRPDAVIFHDDARDIEKYAHCFDMLSFRIALLAVSYFFKRPVACSKTIFKILNASRNFKTKLANLTAIIKALAITDRFIDLGIEHIHAHWGTRTSTFALLVSELTGIPWSLTLHRWDIYENNILQLKAKSASFIRCISEKGKADLLNIVGKEFEEKVQVLRLGVNLPTSTAGSTQRTLKKVEKDFYIALPANLYEVKGHRFLIDAIEILVKDGLSRLKCVFYGDGYLREKLQHDIQARGLSEFVSIHGRIGHDQLLSKYSRLEVDLVVLPSILTDSGHHEGIPVALIEAMAYSIPVVSTNTGSIPELIGDGAGVMVKHMNGDALARAIRELMNNKVYHEELAQKGRLRAEKEYDLRINVSRMINLFDLYRVDPE